MELFDKLLERYSFLSSSGEDKVIENLKKPLKLKFDRKIELTHPNYRGPWHLNYEGSDENESRVVVRERISGPTPTRFVFYSPDMEKDFEKSQEALLLPYKSKPIVLGGTNGIKLSVELVDFPDEKNNSIILSLSNEGGSLTAKDALKTTSLELFDRGFLSQYDHTLVSLPQGHKTILSTKDGVSIVLEGVDLKQFAFSFTEPLKN